MSALVYSPGTLVRARGREWIVLGGSDGEILRLRPISGSEEDATLIHLALEREPVGEAIFPRPSVKALAGHDAALLLRDAMLLSLRRGAGPFRGFGQIAVEPRAYQLVPLLMALKLDPVRLLIADDVGVGKTIEAALIARELLDRGDVRRFTVLCPPHLVDQWVGELENRFHLQPVAVTAAGAKRLERNLPPSESIFTAHPDTVVSLDYIKNDKRRAEFLRACPELVIVDEAHTCAGAGQGRHQRYELLKGLAASERHLVLLTATPHSGDEAAFYRLLGLLHRDFETLGSVSGEERLQLREALARHFVQRRRGDIEDWRDGKIFPTRETMELTYKLSGAWERFFDDVLDYCATIVASAGGDERRQRLSFWGTLALMRCVASSPAAAVQALRTRAGLNEETSEEELLLRVFDGGTDSLRDDDVEPPAGQESEALEGLIGKAERLAGQTGDPKLKLLTDHVTLLLDEGFSPVIFCRFIATAHYVGRHLAGRLRSTEVGVVTGELNSDERRLRVDSLGEADKRVLVATDCLSEGINLQEAFNAVVHYDLSWNPTRHEQREGRVDRFGQESKVVRATLMYGANNPVDGAVLEVILRKAEKIRIATGVPVPMPDESSTLTQALLKAVLLRRRGSGLEQMHFDFLNLPEARELDNRWQDAAEKMLKNSSSPTRFAQRRLRPEDVLPEWHKTLAAVGGREAVERFTGRALARLGAPLEKLLHGFKVPLDALPEALRERLESEGLAGVLRLDFNYPPAARCRAVQRSHPLVAVLAETLLERALGFEPDAEGAEAANRDPGVLGRAGCWIAAGIEAKLVVVLLRLRHQLVTQRQGQTSTLLVEEATALAWGEGRELEGSAALELLLPEPLADPPPHVREREVAKALAQLDGHLAEIGAYAERRAQELLADHRRVREAAAARGTYSVKALLPADVIGLFVLLPRVD